VKTKAERRSAASRWVRYWSLHGKLAALMVLLGWALLASADAGVQPPPTEHALEVIKLLAGGGILTFGIVAGVTKWIVEPAVLRAIARHKDEINAHAAYITRLEWDAKHTELSNKVDAANATVLDAIANLGKRSRGHE
jgi:hypothetical protein